MGTNSLIDSLIEDKTLIQGEDGCWVFWPTENKGAYTQENLLSIYEWMAPLNEIIYENWIEK